MRSLMLVTALLVVSSAAMGCECSTPMPPPGGDAATVHCGDSCLEAMPPGAPMGQMCCESTQMCVDYDVNALCMAGFTCPVANVTMDASCHITCSMCVERPRLNPGYLATDLDFVITPTGDQYLSGYSPGNPPMPVYGDMVVGSVPGGEVGMLTWEIVDGAPTMPVTGAPSGWRHGVAAPGDDVGRWTSMVASNTSLYVSYYDVTHGALRLARGLPGDWHVTTVDDMGDAGRYSSIVLTSSGAPAISYLAFTTDATTGAVSSEVRVAVASNAMPAMATDWTISHVGTATSPCRPNLCGMGQRCLASGTCTMASGTCAPACTGDTVCVMGTCQATLPMDYTEDLVPAHGLYTQLVVTTDGFALIYYDRTEGNLYGVQATGTTWGTPFLIDGYGRSDPTTGDSGEGASLFVDGTGTWHVTYVDGAEEVLRYASVTPGPTPTIVREVIDDGSTIDGTMPQMDGRHIVGDDSSVVVLASGEVRVAYQDSTTERTMIARRSPAGVWSHGVLDMEKHNGWWVEQVVNTAGTESWVASWWIDRMGTAVTNGVHITQVPAAP
jgi:hypothetical protein